MHFPAVSSLHPKGGAPRDPRLFCGPSKATRALARWGASSASIHASLAQFVMLPSVRVCVVGLMEGVVSVVALGAKAHFWTEAVDLSKQTHPSPRR